MEKLRKDVQEAGWFARMSLAVGLIAMLVALVGSATSVYVAKRDARHVAVNANAKRAILHEQDVISCRDRHLTNHAWIVYLAPGIAANKRLLANKAALRGLSPQLVAESRAGLKRSNRLIRALRKADCDPNDPLDLIPLNRKEK